MRCAHLQYLLNRALHGMYWTILWRRTLIKSRPSAGTFAGSLLFGRRAKHIAIVPSVHSKDDRRWTVFHVRETLDRKLEEVPDEHVFLTCFWNP